MIRVPRRTMWDSWQDYMYDAKQLTLLGRLTWLPIVAVMTALMLILRVAAAMVCTVVALAFVTGGRMFLRFNLKSYYEDILEWSLEIAFSTDVGRW